MSSGEWTLRCAAPMRTARRRSARTSCPAAELNLSWPGACVVVQACQLIAEAVFSARRPAFLALRERWRGRIVLQGVALVVLSYFRCALCAHST